MKHILTILILLTLTACNTSQRSPVGQPIGPTALEFRRADDLAFTKLERDLISAAWRGILQSGKLPAEGSKDAYYRVRHHSDGYEVFAIYVTGYEGNQPIFSPCVHNEVLLSHEAKVINVLSGPECWP